LYQLGRAEDARRIFYPMLDGYAAGEFQGFGDHGRSRDWRDWKGGCHGYEGLLVDNYHALLAVFDEVNASETKAAASAAPRIAGHAVGEAGKKPEEKNTPHRYEKLRAGAVSGRQ